MTKTLLILLTAVGLSGCAGQGTTTEMPIGVSKSINGLQRSPCVAGKCKESSMPVYAPQPTQVVEESN